MVLLYNLVLNVPWSFLLFFDGLLFLYLLLIQISTTVVIPGNDDQYGNFGFAMNYDVAVNEDTSPTATLTIRRRAGAFGTVTVSGKLFAVYSSAVTLSICPKYSCFRIACEH